MHTKYLLLRWVYSFLTHWSWTPFSNVSIYHLQLVRLFKIPWGRRWSFSLDWWVHEHFSSYINRLSTHVTGLPTPPVSLKCTCPPLIPRCITAILICSCTLIGQQPAVYFSKLLCHIASRAVHHLFIISTCEQFQVESGSSEGTTQRELYNAISVWFHHSSQKCYLNAHSQSHLVRT